MAASLPRRDAPTAMNSVPFTAQIVYAAIVALAMISAGLSKRRLEWKPRPPKRRKGGSR
jgi:hypothetical protein